MEHQFPDPGYTIGIEEELMILDAESFDLANEVEALLEPAPSGEIKPELMESVLEISTDPCDTTVIAAVQLRALDKAIYVANGMRAHIAVLLALSASSPFWQGNVTGLASTREPIFRASPRVGIPPGYRDWTDYERRIQFTIRAGVIADYTYLWHDVRPHPAFGTVEVRAMDAQTRLAHTLGLAALIQALVRELAEHFDAGSACPATRSRCSTRTNGWRLATASTASW